MSKFLQLYTENMPLTGNKTQTPSTSAIPAAVTRTPSAAAADRFKVQAGSGIKAGSTEPAKKKGGFFSTAARALRGVGKVANAITTGQQIAKGNYDLGGLKDIESTDETETPSVSAAPTTITPTTSAAPEPQTTTTPTVTAATPKFDAAARKFEVGDIHHYKTNSGKDIKVSVTDTNPNPKMPEVVQVKAGNKKFAIDGDRVGKKIPNVKDPTALQKTPTKKPVAKKPASKKS